MWLMIYVYKKLWMVEGILTFGSFYSILQMIEDFYHSDKEYGLFLENDVYLHKNLKEELTYACHMYSKLNLDVLLVGYLLNCLPEHYGYQLIYQDKYKFYRYDDHLWGSHGFILNKKQAKKLIDKYTVQYALDPSRVEIMCSDWVFTKQGKRALISVVSCSRSARTLYRAEPTRLLVHYIEQTLSTTRH